jgi:flagellar M-ring protein FliF
MKNFGQSLLDLWKQLGLNQRVSLVVASLAVIAGLVAISLWSRRPDYQLLYGHLGDKDAAAIISYLEAQNVPHQITAGGTAVEVPTDQVYKLRMDLAGKGLPGGDGVGFEIFDKGQFGLSDFVQRTNYLRAVQGELARTITQLQGVRAARVMIVQPENRLLLTDQNVKSTASVFIDLGGGRIDPDQVNAIRHLVANSVQGLQPDEVAVVDNHGHTLSEELKQDPTLGSASSQMRYRQQVEDYFGKKVETMLAAVIGPNNAVVRVSADIDTESITQSDEKFDPESAVIRSETTNDDTSNTVESHASGGAVGVSSNVPDKPAAGDAGGAHPSSTANTGRKTKTTTYEINRTLVNTTRSPGKINSLTASVFIAAAPAGKDGTVPQRSQEDLNKLRQVVINALGLKAAPGASLDNLVTLQEMTFAAPPAIDEIKAMEAESRWPAWAEAASRWAAFGGAVLVLLVFLRILSRQKPEPVPVEILTLPPDLAARALPSGGSVTADMVNELIRQKPTNVGTALRGWVTATAATKN